MPLIKPIKAPLMFILVQFSFNCAYSPFCHPFCVSLVTAFVGLVAFALSLFGRFAFSKVSISLLGYPSSGIDKFSVRFALF